MEVFDGLSFLEEKFQNPRGLLAFLTAYNVTPPTDAAVFKWFQRGAIPAPWLALLLSYLEVDTGKPQSLIPYMRKNHEPN